MSKIEESVWYCIEPAIKELGMEIYDVEYLKEGTNWYLRIYIDKKGNISINDCELVSRTINPLLDELDPIKEAYCLEVSSPGIERILRREEHFDKSIGLMVEVSLFKPVDGNKKIQGILQTASEQEIVILSADKEIVLQRKDISTVKTVFEF